LKIDMPLEQGDLLYNRYRIREILGRGGMGSVFRAVDESLGMEVAVKENLFITEDYERQFRLEAVILASLRHPNMPRVTDHFVIEDQGQYLVMDYIEGKDLRQIMEKNGQLPESEAVRIGVAICDALSYLHSRKPPVLHRDIKPGNIRIAPDGQVYLVDFGLAKMAEVDENTLTGARAMTPGYSPPEQYGTSRTDPRTDVYSLGATLYAALAAYVPEDGLARAMDEVKLTPLRKRNPKVSPRVAAAIEKAMEPSQPNRFQTAEDFKRALLGVEPSQPEPAKSDTVPPPPAYRPVSDSDQVRPAPARRKTPAFSLAVLVAVLFVIGSLANWMFQNPESAPQILRPLFPLSPTFTPTPTATFTQQPTATPSPLPSLTVTSMPTATQTPTRKPPFTLTAGTPLVVPLTTQPPETPSITPTATLTPTEAPTFTPAPTLTGGGASEIAFASLAGNTTQIFISDIVHANIRQVTNEMGGACQPSWSPDGAKFVFISPCSAKSDLYPKAGLYIFNLETNEVEPLPADPAGDFEPAWSPSGDEIAFTSLRDGKQPQIFSLSLADLSVKQLTKSAGNIQARQPAWSPDGEEIVYTVRRLGLLQIWSMSADGSNQLQLVRTGGSFSDYMPVWSPDGAYILFSQTNSDLTAPSSLKKFILGASEAQLLDATLLPVVDVSFSPDGTWIAYESAINQNQDIYLYNLLTGKRSRLTTADVVDFDPAWRP
jgi:eukaryotic-like serine/threonine-protein kinase